MQVIKSTENNYCIIFTPTELQAFQVDIDSRHPWDVKDLASLIEWVLKCHLEEIDSRQREPDSHGIQRT